MKHGCRYMLYIWDLPVRGNVTQGWGRFGEQAPAVVNHETQSHLKSHRAAASQVCSRPHGYIHVYIQPSSSRENMASMRNVFWFFQRSESIYSRMAVHIYIYTHLYIYIYIC